MAIQGLRTTSNFATDERPKSWREGILRLSPNGSVPLTALSSMMKSRSVDDPEYYWWDKEVQTRRIALGGNITTATTALTVASGALGLKAGELLYAENSGEIMRVTSDPAADTSVTVQRGYGGSTATAITYAGAGVNPYLVVIGSAYEEGSSAPTGVNFDPTKRYNYTQIFRNTLEATNTALETNLRTTDQAKEAKRECLELHGMDMERAFWLGKRSESTLNGKPIRTMNGIIQQIDSGNVVSDPSAEDAYNSGVTMEQLEEWMYNIFKYGSNEKMAFGGNRALLTIQQILRKNASWQFSSGVKEYGMNVTRISSPFGELVFKNHPLFNQMTGGTTGGTAYYGMESWMVVLDMANIQYVNLKNRDTKYQPKLQDNGVDGLKSGYLTECSLELHHPKSHYLIKNVAVAAADA